LFFREITELLTIKKTWADYLLYVEVLPSEVSLIIGAVLVICGTQDSLIKQYIHRLNME
jgi:hypothetical protein